MDWFSYLALLTPLLILTAISIDTRFRIAGITREIRSEARSTHDELTAALQRIDTLEVALIQALTEYMEGHFKEAKSTLAIASELPKPHRHQWRINSREETNRQNRIIHVCKVEGCRDTYVEETPMDGGSD